MSSELREQLAAYAHEAWSAYMTYFLNKLEVDDQGNLIIPAAYGARLRRQASTSFADLTFVEQDFDRAEADKMIALMPAAVPQPVLSQADQRLQELNRRISEYYLALRNANIPEHTAHDLTLDLSNEMTEYFGAH